MTRAEREALSRAVKSTAKLIERRPLRASLEDELEAQQAAQERREPENVGTADRGGAPRGS